MFINRPFPSCSEPLFYSEVTCGAFLIQCQENVFFLICGDVNKTHKKGILCDLL